MFHFIHMLCLRLNFQKLPNLQSTIPVQSTEKLNKQSNKTKLTPEATLLVFSREEQSAQQQVVHRNQAKPQTTKQHCKNK